MHDNFTGRSRILRPPPPLDSSLLNFLFHKFIYLFCHIQLAILIAFELLSNLFSFLISFLSMIANSLTYNFYLGKQSSPTAIQKLCNRAHAVTMYFAFSSLLSHFLYTILKRSFNIPQQLSAATLALQRFLF